MEHSWILNIQMVFPLHFQLDGSDCYRDIVVRAVTDREPARLQSENYPYLDSVPHQCCDIASVGWES